VAYPEEMRWREGDAQPRGTREGTGTARERSGSSDGGTISNTDDNRHWQPFQPLGKLGSGIASYSGSDGEARTLSNPDSRRLEIERERGILAGIGQAFGSDLDGRGSQAMADADEAQCAGDRSSEPNEAQHGAARRPSRRAAQCGLGGGSSRVSAWMDGSWEEGIPRTTRGQSERVNRLKCLGNSIVPQIAEMIFARISV
jgi:hypothetical protein